MNTTQNLSLDLYNCEEDRATSTSSLIDSFSDNFQKIDDFSITDKTLTQADKIADAKAVGEKIEELKTTIGTIHGLHGTKSGEIVTVEDADAGSPFKNISVSGAYEQFATTGKNLLKLAGEHDMKIGGVSIDVADDGTVTLNGTLDMNGDSVKNIVLGNASILSWESGKICNISVWQVSGSATLGSGTGNTFAYSIFSQDYNTHFQGSTTDTDLTNYKGVDTATNLTPGIVILQIWRDGTVFNDFKFRLQVETGTLATSYEPYTGGKASPCLDYPQEPTILKNPIVKVSGSDTNNIDREVSFVLPEGHQYVGMLPDTTHDIVEISADGAVTLAARIWHKKLKFSDMNNLENYPGWSIPKDDELMSYIQDSIHALVSGMNSIGVLLKVNTVGDTIRIYGEKSDFNNLTQPELIAKYPNVYVDIYGKIETEEVKYVLGTIDPVLAPSSTINIWVDSEIQTDISVDYPRDINIIIKNIEEKLDTLINNS